LAEIPSHDSLYEIFGLAPPPLTAVLETKREPTKMA
jgi:hypothetical protein